MKYEIREIVDLVSKIKTLDPTLTIFYENIGDPVAKGWPVPSFLKELIIEQTKDDSAFAYTNSKGRPETTEWIAAYAKKFSPGIKLESKDVLITSGLGAAISMMYEMLPKGTRVLQPSPSYPTHASMESFNAKSHSISYNLDPENSWQPDLKHMEEQIVANPSVVGILLINPNNPTGAIYSKETCEKVVALAEKYNLFIISDEIYFRLVYGDTKFPQISEIAENRVPLIVMRGLSKDVPWPGARCGWLEFHGTHLDESFFSFCEAIKKRVLMEVCSTTLPQFLLPQIYDHPDFPAWLKQYKEGLDETITEITQILEKTPGLKVHRAFGAFYMLPIFAPGVLKPGQTLPIQNTEVRTLIEKITADPSLPLDKRFAYYLLASTGICVVPASSFFSPYFGFRITTLYRDKQKRAEIYKKLSDSVQEYLNS